MESNLTTSSSTLWSYDDMRVPKYINILFGASDKLRIYVFYAMKTSKNACIIRSECTFTHTYCCVSKLSKFGTYLYAVDDNTSCT